MLRSGKIWRSFCENSRSLHPINIGATGFEPATSWSQTTRSTKLSYAPFCETMLTITNPTSHPENSRSQRREMTKHERRMTKEARMTKHENSISVLMQLFVIRHSSFRGWCCCKGSFFRRCHPESRRRRGIPRQLRRSSNPGSRKAKSLGEIPRLGSG